MATCLVEITGTSGYVVISYRDASNNSRRVIAGVGQIYLDDDGSEYEWYTLSGDAGITSGCISFIQLSVGYYRISWEILPNSVYDPGVHLDSVDVGNDSWELNGVAFPLVKPEIMGQAINSSGLERVRAVSYLTVKTDKTEAFLILKIIGDGPPFLRIYNANASHVFYLKGELSMEIVPEGYTPIEYCEFNFIAP